MKYLLDTSVVIALTRGVGHVKNFVEENMSFGFYISSITIGELYYGIYKSTNRNKGIFDVQVFVQTQEVIIVDYDISMAETYGILMSRLTGAGLTSPPVDTMLAVTADSLDVPIVTLDKKHFPRLVDFGIQVKVLG